MKSSHQHLKCAKISNPTKATARKYGLESIVVNRIPFQLTTLHSKGHNFYMLSPNEKIITSMKKSPQHLKCLKISKPTKAMGRKYA
jgi:hypothetical protein